MYLRADSMDGDGGGAGRVRQAKGLINNDKGLGRGRGIRDAFKGLETMTEAVGDRQEAQGIYDDDGCIGGGR